MIPVDLLVLAQETTPPPPPATGGAGAAGLVGLVLLALTIVFFIRVVEGGHKATSGGSFVKGLVPVFLAIMTLGAYKAGTLFSSLETLGAGLYTYVSAAVLSAL